MKALEEENRAYFSPWTAEHEIGQPPIDELLATKNQRVLDYAKELKSWLEYYKSKRAGLYSELKYEVVDQLIEIVRNHFPTAALSRGTHDQETGYEGSTVQFLREVYFDITGVHDRLDAPIQRCL